MQGMFHQVGRQTSPIDLSKHTFFAYFIAFYPRVQRSKVVKLLNWEADF